MTRTGARGGNVRSLTEARTLTETFKARWTAIVDEALREALQRGPTHADDLAHLELPPEHLNLIGSRIARLVNRGKIVEVGRRKSRNPASNARKSGIYELTPKGVVGLRAGSQPGGGTLIYRVAASPESGDPGVPESSLASGAPARLFELEPVRRKHDTLEAA